MKLWDVLAICVLMLSTASTTPLFRSWEPIRKRSHLQELQEEPSLTLKSLEDHMPMLDNSLEETDYNMPDQYPDQLEEVVEFIQATIKRLRRSSERQTSAQSKQSQRKASATKNTSNRRSHKGKRRNRGCVLREIHLNVTDLELGYKTKEELIFKYCSGSCDAPETTYDIIVKNLTKKKKLVKDEVKQACCRPTAFDDDLSFLDDNLEYHTLKKHSAKKCGCI
ncbi:glial cell line-derived neurotrophic factor [Latimeria chalumnae]|uniref:Glial cell line-derived neurotrophic factor n=1 Tax=Latimeria chalumnae TaxID=7897 RepID=H3ABN7_LATCH|nr:PREDICTED: glial cell line-derived neurotrophic factor [Latimeria chalumnae]|eukprot:XP_006007492.1 PREDICTED: glial cell line-derived neurotrophic factor [Latimeria chalumnae]